MSTSRIINSHNETYENSVHLIIYSLHTNHSIQWSGWSPEITTNKKMGLLTFPENKMLFSILRWSCFFFENFIKDHVNVTCRLRQRPISINRRRSEINEISDYEQFLTASSTYMEISELVKWRSVLSEPVNRLSHL